MLSISNDRSIRNENLNVLNINDPTTYKYVKETAFRHNENTH